MYIPVRGLQVDWFSRRVLPWRIRQGNGCVRKRAPARAIETWWRWFDYDGVSCFLAHSLTKPHTNSNQLNQCSVRLYFGFFFFSTKIIHLVLYYFWLHSLNLVKIVVFKSFTFEHNIRQTIFWRTVMMMMWMVVRFDGVAVLFGVFRRLFTIANNTQYFSVTNRQHLLTFFCFAWYVCQQTFTLATGRHFCCTKLYSEMHESSLHNSSHFLKNNILTRIYHANV